ncbi:hypothetical protein KBI52_02010 [Microvirga sp. HBU67558]|uniref:hypothetical protein n=1 Tax=Microvirga TaxID=186650 RepID=UPI001B38A0C5|nr:MULTISPECIES: hypothetical protein [unclassified Microvirga]MBQ0819036.1 hypothetical protein [Microvirga sp. HBU67558]
MSTFVNLHGHKAVGAIVNVVWDSGINTVVAFHLKYAGNARQAHCGVIRRIRVSYSAGSSRCIGNQHSLSKQLPRLGPTVNNAKHWVVSSINIFDER